MRPRRFYIGFPPAILKTTRNGIEYGLGAIPLGGFVKIPGMHRPAPVDVDAGLSRALHEEPASERRGRTAAQRACRGRPRRRARLAAGARRARRRARADAGDGGLGAPRARRPERRARARRLLACADVEARHRDRGGAGRQHPARARALHGALHDVGREADDDGRGDLDRTRRRSRWGCSRATGSSRSAERVSRRGTSPRSSPAPRDGRCRSSSCATGRR